MNYNLQNSIHLNALFQKNSPVSKESFPRNCESGQSREIQFTYMRSSNESKEESNKVIRVTGVEMSFSSQTNGTQQDK